MSSGSSSEDENLAKFKESVVTINDLNEEIKINTDKLNVRNDEKKLNNQYNNDYDDDDEQEETGITPEFQEYISKKLNKLLESSIEIIETQIKGNRKLNNVENDTEFHLTKTIVLKTTEDIGTEENKNIKKKKKQKQKKRHRTSSNSDESSSDDDLEKMCGEAAISHDQLLVSTCINEHKLSKKNKS